MALSNALANGLSGNSGDSVSGSLPVEKILIEMYIYIFFSVGKL